MKGLIVDEPWIGAILSGRKSWEMRSSRTTHRGRFALIRKGSGLVVGLADLIGCEPAIVSLEAYAAAEARHCIPAERQKAAFEGRWRIPWVLADVVSLARPVPYVHPRGAVTWVVLADDVAATIADALSAP
ncbi:MULTISPECIES: ASCH domain-containing protein [Methylosinus]|uniref:ASCH domain-containing protein n=1 Tax=Methylosinus trichosporium (strain ATCC 35070 / NCIMB 11131 / UNIQEM 75 / OB3b) TaxID=595536 RepID=A0A2D2CXI5_METT3|nr:MULTISPECIES: ASCH domain-containing protein [Methylosinus]ATQ67457.1 ASCH domain-containing protein [Methylosinus trichosporium OB3b]OBS50884.1 hypothetical protein A8B73_19155 [Methylosinus sp. 3S-1]